MTVPAGITRDHIDGYRLYRKQEHNSRKAGWVVLVSVNTEDETTARDFVDATLHAIETDPELPREGGISAFFHIREDGRHVINYAEWASEEAHEAALATPGAGVGSETPEWRRVQTFPGVTRDRVERYRV